MNRLLAFCLCTAFVSADCGDDPFVVVPGKSATTASEKDDNTAGGTDAADEREWKPRLRVVLHTPGAGNDFQGFGGDNPRLAPAAGPPQADH